MQLGVKVGKFFRTGGNILKGRLRMFTKQSTKTLSQAVLDKYAENARAVRLDVLDEVVNRKKVYTIKQPDEDRFVYGIGHYKQKLSPALVKDNAVVMVHGGGAIGKILREYEPYTFDTFVKIDFGDRQDLKRVFDTIRFTAIIYPKGWALRAIAGKNKADLIYIENRIKRLDKNLIVVQGPVAVNKVDFMDFKAFVKSLEFGGLRAPVWIPLLKRISSDRWIKLIGKRKLAQSFKQYMRSDSFRKELRTESPVMPEEVASKYNTLIKKLIGK